MHYIYLIITSEFVKSGEQVYKIGKTTQRPEKRMAGYPKGSKIILFISVDDCHSFEKRLLELFKDSFKRRTDAGSEYFEGDVNAMIDTIQSYAKSRRDQLKKAKQLTLDTIDPIDQVGFHRELELARSSVNFIVNHSILDALIPVKQPANRAIYRIKESVVWQFVSLDDVDDDNKGSESGRDTNGDLIDEVRSEKSNLDNPSLSIQTLLAIRYRCAYIIAELSKLIKKEETALDIAIPNLMDMGGLIFIEYFGVNNPADSSTDPKKHKLGHYPFDVTHILFDAKLSKLRLAKIGDFLVDSLSYGCCQINVNKVNALSVSCDEKFVLTLETYFLKDLNHFMESWLDSTNTFKKILRGVLTGEDAHYKIGRKKNAKLDSKSNKKKFSIWDLFVALGSALNLPLCFEDGDQIVKINQTFIELVSEGNFDLGVSDVDLNDNFISGVISYDIIDFDCDTCMMGKMSFDLILPVLIWAVNYE